VSADLASVAPKVWAVRFVSAEAVYSDRNIDQAFGGRVFRISEPRYVAQILTPMIYGRYGGVFIRGLLGHCRGKEALRTGIARADIDIHDASVDGRPLNARRAQRRYGFWLAHYDAINFAPSCDKFARRLTRKAVLEMGRKWELQLSLCAERTDEAGRHDPFCDLCMLPLWKRRVRRALGFLLEIGPQLKATGPKGY